MLPSCIVLTGKNKIEIIKEIKIIVSICFFIETEVSAEAKNILPKNDEDINIIVFKVIMPNIVSCIRHNINNGINTLYLLIESELRIFLNLGLMKQYGKRRNEKFIDLIGNERYGGNILIKNKK